MAIDRHFPTYSDVRTNLSGVFNAAHEGVITTITRNGECFVVLPALDRTRELRRLLPEAVVVAEGGGWAAFLPGVPVHGDAGTFSDAIDDLIDALREYAEDWNERLRRAPNHVQHRRLVEFVELSSDPALRDWLTGADQLAPAALTTA